MDRISYKRILAQTLIVIAVLLTAIGGFVAWIDPYQQYRKHDTYLGDQRMEIGGVSRNHDYNAFITGSSMAMNHNPALADSLWGWKTKNFSIMGATDDDYEVMLPYILSHGKARNVILDLDFFSFQRQRGAVNPYLYDNNIWNDYEYLWNYTSLKNAIRFMLNPQSEDGLYHFRSPKTREALIKNYQSNNLTGYGDEIVDMAEMQRRFDTSVLRIIRDSSSSIQWHVYFPPYSIGEFIVYENHGNLDTILAFKRYMISQLTPLHNVRLYDFQRSPLIDNLDEYMDLRHHGHEYNNLILQAIHDTGPNAELTGNSSEIRRLVKQYTDSFPAHPSDV